MGEKRLGLNAELGVRHESSQISRRARRHGERQRQGLGADLGAGLAAAGRPAGPSDSPRPCSPAGRNRRTLGCERFYGLLGPLH